jgi:predicted regulator of Ras-like GTPase activity (Roadblock/LC7/MglB family)
MDFRECLETICGSVDGAIAATLMGIDGLPVESYEAPTDDPPTIDVGSLLVEFSTVLGQVRQSAETFSAGSLTEISIRSEQLTTIIRTLNEEYFVALAMKPAGNTGKGRYLLRIHAPNLLKDLA